MGEKKTGKEKFHVNYEIELLTQLCTGKKNVYQIFKEICSKNREDKVYYATVLRAVERAEKEKLVKRGGAGQRDAKIYQITLKGLANLYILKRRGIDPLRFHKSPDGKKIIRSVIKIFGNHPQLKEIINNNLFIQTLNVSPSSIFYFIDVGEKALTINILKDVDMLRKIWDLVGDQSRMGLNLCIKKFLDPWMLLQNFYIFTFPLIVLTKDIKNFPRDSLIRATFLEALKQKSISRGNEWELNAKAIVDTMLHGIKKGTIDPSRSLDDVMGKLWESPNGENHMDCWQHWYVFIPPVGNPELVCDGKCSK